MRLVKNLIILLVIAGIIIAGSMVVSRQVRNGAGLNVARNSVSPKNSWVGNYLAGYHAALTKDYNKASEYFSDSLSLNSKSSSELLQTQSMSLLLLAGKFDEAVVIAKNLNAKSDNGLARLTLIVDQVQKNNLAEAEKLSELKKSDSSTIINKIILAWIKFGEKKPQEAENILKSLESDQTFLPFINYNYALIAELSGDNETAKRLYDSLLAMKQLPNGIAAAAYDFYKQQNNKEQLKVLADKFNYDGKTKKHPKITNAKEGVAEALLGVGGIVMTEYSPDKSAALFRLALYLNPKLDDAKLLLGSILMNEGDYKGANDILSLIKSDSYLGDYAKLAIGKNFEAMDENSKARDYFENLSGSVETKLDAMISLGDLERKDEKFEKAVEYYTKAIEIATATSKTGKLEAKYWAIYFARGVSYERLNQLDKSEADLNKALELQPNQPDVLNYLGYVWIDAGRNLDKAKDMVMKAHQEKPEDPQIIDSVGWAFFKLGNYPYSVQYLEAAAGLLPYDPVVNDHLGDAYWQTDRHNEAKYQWQRALNNEPEAKLADQLKKKLENGLTTKIANDDNKQKSLQ